MTDDFYSTWTQCYEELFHASLSPKYVQRKDSTASSTTSTTFTSKAGSATTRWDKQANSNGLKHSVSELNLASPCNDEFVPRGGARSRSNDKRMQRLSLDVSTMSFDGEYGITPNKRLTKDISLIQQTLNLAPCQRATTVVASVNCLACWTGVKRFINCLIARCTSIVVEKGDLRFSLRGRKDVFLMIWIEINKTLFSLIKRFYGTCFRQLPLKQVK